MVQTAFKDNLTALYNRHYFAAAIAGRVGRGSTGNEAALLMIDIDDFKQINDKHGHAMGDAVLRQLADLLRASIRKNDAAIRWGGEEFLVFLTGADKNSARLFAERLRATVERHPFGQDPHTVAVTVSIGIAAATATADLEQLIRLADDALYRAKQTKNKVIA
ncbi:GGDEF domain-containing protein [Selenomonadales bacterium 4137-cl]|uniref:GGDEF domain-containing protein n=1 Tax=Anaeroselena agilis TaxID=3063788 RepID=A0ABU3P056_9FIRM|nr:GGDEF domain-containing protein [Selenomonadales bacterium 4137-cl]